MKPKTRRFLRRQRGTLIMIACLSVGIVALAVSSAFGGCGTTLSVIAAAIMVASILGGAAGMVVGYRDYFRYLRNREYLDDI